MQGWFIIQNPISVFHHVNKPKKRKSIIWIGAKKVFDKTQILPLIKNQKVGKTRKLSSDYNRELLQLNKRHKEKPILC